LSEASIARSRRDGMADNLDGERGLATFNRPRRATTLVSATLTLAFCVFAITAPTLAADKPPAMFVPGKFNVNQSGAATYTVPIAAPPGTAGMEPALSLDYSSAAGDGVVGLGWTLSGLPSISRCPRTVAQDTIHGNVNYNTNDKFCLDGQRLMVISGTYGADG